MKLTEVFPIFRSVCKRPLARIRIDDAAGDVRTYDCEELPLTVGRGELVDIRLTDHQVSKVHCRLLVIDGQLWVRDLDSLNGTAVNHVTVDERYLSVGDMIAIGRSWIEVLYTASRKRLAHTNPSTEIARTDA